MIYCPNCGIELPEDYEYCYKCGNRMFFSPETNNNNNQNSIQQNTQTITKIEAQEIMRQYLNESKVKRKKVKKNNSARTFFLFLILVGLVYFLFGDYIKAYYYQNFAFSDNFDFSIDDFEDAQVGYNREDNQSFDDWINSIQGSWTEVTDSNCYRVLTIDGYHISVNEMKSGHVMGNRTNCNGTQGNINGEYMLYCDTNGWNVRVYSQNNGLVVETDENSYYFTRSGN